MPIWVYVLIGFVVVGVGYLVFVYCVGKLSRLSGQHERQEARDREIDSRIAREIDRGRERARGMR